MVASACGDDSNASDAESSNACPPEKAECKELANFQAGQQAVVKRRCVNCHGQDMSGSLSPLPGIPSTPLGEAVELYPPNLTSHETGVGHWSDDALALAIRYGIDEESQALCPQMQHYSEMSDFEVYSIIKYLREIPKVDKRVPRSVCPPTKTKEQQSL